ncbi:hypothetical protein ISCGN_024504 [Ixodes scapularis]
MFGDDVVTYGQLVAPSPDRRSEQKTGGIKPAASTEASVGPRGGRSWAGRVHRCTLCDYATSQPESLAQHGMWHRGEPPFKCSQCDKRFFQRSSASAHLRTHTGERPFRCCFCTRSFVVKGDLTRHVRTHTGERPFRCRHCPRAFSDQGNLLKHERKCH